MTTYTTTRQVEFAETDMAGIMHFANFYRWMENVEHEFFRSMGLSIHTELDGQHIGWPRLESICKFKRPLKFEGLRNRRHVVILQDQGKEDPVVSVSPGRIEASHVDLLTDLFRNGTRVLSRRVNCQPEKTDQKNGEWMSQAICPHSAQK